ncbi:protein dispatched homolog 2 [Anguilla anguilla]|uniref:protein dispatched homolog 2 n=1 Tax=Anguilla anguilla TaxID=7936 RepID=UPI0015AB66F0|nr:protein dispatched homolog 2 [Anguilla anguilla]
MDAPSDSEENAHVIIMDSTRAERPAQEGSQSDPSLQGDKWTQTMLGKFPPQHNTATGPPHSRDQAFSFHEIPEVSLCPPDSPDLEDLHRTSSPSQLYHQVPMDCPHLSPHLKRCHCCRNHQPTTDSPCPGTFPATASPHPDCSSSSAKTTQSRGPSHMPSCHDSVQCHWLQGSYDDGVHQPVQHHIVTVRHEGLHRIPRSYSQLIVEFPMAVLVTCALVLFGCSLAGILIGPLPDFSDPLLGFEPRGTSIGNRLSAWAKLQLNMGPGKALSPSPPQLTDRAVDGYVDRNGGDISGSQQTTRIRPRRMVNWDLVQDTFFCDSPGEHYAQLVFRSGNSASLWSLKAIHSMCEMEQARIRSHAQFQDLCKQGQLEMGGTAARLECCPSWSLGNYLAVLSNATSCLGLTAQQVSNSLNLLRQCAPYYHDGSLAPSCSKRGKLGHCASVPPQCKHSSAVYQILHYLVDKDFLGPQTIVYKVPSLKYSLLFLPVEKGDPMMKIYLDNLEGRDLTYKNTTITGMDLGIKRTLLKYYLARDSVYPVLAIVILCLTVALYLRSFFLSVMSLAAIIGSLLTSYFLYKVAFKLTFFPFLNLAAVLVLLGNCSNQVFAFIDLWGLQLSQKPPATLEKRVNRVLQEVGYLILASGLTSSATFYSGYMSSITAVRCFAVYLGTASLISTLLAMVWLPCSLILRERYAVSVGPSAPAGKPCCALSPAGFWETSSRKRCLFMMVRKLRGLKRGLADTSDLLFIKLLPCGVVKFRYIWICWFTVLATGGTYITCVDPGMKLPALYSKATQLFRSSHPFERYDAEYRHQFMFERQKSGEDKPMTITLVWGVLPTDNGDHLNPKSNGSLVLDPHFNMSRPEAQVWLRELCGKIQNQSFYSLPSSSPKEEVRGDNICFVEQLIHWVSIRRCSESDDVFTFCCNDIPFPYTSAVFEHCLGMMAAEKHGGGNQPSTAGPYFDSEGQIAVLVMEFKTTHLYSFNFSQTTDFYNEIEMWFNKEISGAPLGLHRGWFVSQLALYDLQQCLSSETLVVTGFSVVLTFVLLLLTTWNIPLSIYGAAAVGGSVFVTVGLLVLLEWQLTGLEALFISAAAGLSVDFTANYCISYSLAPHSDRLGRVAHSLKRMGCPVAIGAGSFFCVGVIMLPATALLFRKLGIFLLLVKCVACCFATFFFQSLCCFFGPDKNCGQILWPCTPATSQYTVKGTENMLSSCSASRPGSSDSAANGAFRCGGKTHLQRSYGKGGSGGNHLCPGQQRHRQRQGRGGREPEQYELQPLACQLNDSFENSTCTSKLSNRPSVLSDEIQFHSLSPGKDLERQSMENPSKGSSCRHLNSCNPPALQTSSPYRENTLWPAMTSTADLTQGRLLCRRCQSQSGGIRHWNVSLSSSSSMEDIIISSQPLDTSHRRSLSTEGATGSPFKCQPHQHLLSSQSQSSFDGLEDSNETCLSDIEPGPSIPQAPNKVEGEPEPGHLNGKRDTLRLSLRETVFEAACSGTGKGRSSQGDLPVILPNSKPGLPDVWIKREGQSGDGS